MLIVLRELLELILVVREASIDAEIPADRQTDRQTDRRINQHHHPCQAM